MHFNADSYSNFSILYDFLQCIYNEFVYNFLQIVNHISG